MTDVTKDTLPVDDLSVALTTVHEGVLVGINALQLQNKEQLALITTSVITGIMNVLRAMNEEYFNALCQVQKRVFDHDTCATYSVLSAGWLARMLEKTPEVFGVPIPTQEEFFKDEWVAKIYFTLTDMEERTNKREYMKRLAFQETQTQPRNTKEDGQ